MQAFFRIFMLSLSLSSMAMSCRTRAPQQGEGSPPVIYTLSLVEGSDKALIDKDHPGSAGNRQGYEGGIVFRHEGIYHLFVTEEVSGWDGTRTGHWKSADGLRWDRTGTVQQSVKRSHNPRHAIWSPMPIYHEKEGRWNLFYVGYEFSGNENGRVFRAVSDKPGPGGLDGPYTDQPGTILSFSDSSLNSWEGRQGTDSFFPFRVGKKWMAFYGSSDAKSHWDVGLATADSLEGPWKRIQGPPVFTRAENPIVTTLRDGTYLAVYDDLTSLSANSHIGYAWSRDGLHWTHSFLPLPMPVWTRNIRTPQSLVPAGNGEYWIYFTGQSAGGFDKIGRIRVKVGRARG